MKLVNTLPHERRLSVLLTFFMIRIGCLACLNCDESHSCAFGNITTNWQDYIVRAGVVNIDCFGDSSCAESNLIENTIKTNINCHGSYSCYQTKTIIIRNSSYNYNYPATQWNPVHDIAIECYGFKSCDSVELISIDDSIIGDIKCLGLFSCQNSTLDISNGDIYCDGERGCQNSIIYATNNVRFGGYFAGSNTTIISKIDRQTDISFEGHFSGYGANVICQNTQNSKCDIRCTGYSCVNLTLSCNTTATSGAITTAPANCEFNIDEQDCVSSPAGLFGDLCDGVENNWLRYYLLNDNYYGWINHGNLNTSLSFSQKNSVYNQYYQFKKMLQFGDFPSKDEELKIMTKLFLCDGYEICTNESIVDQMGWDYKIGNDSGFVTTNNKVIECSARESCFFTNLWLSHSQRTGMSNFTGIFNSVLHTILSHTLLRCDGYLSCNTSNLHYINITNTNSKYIENDDSYKLLFDDMYIYGSGFLSLAGIHINHNNHQLRSDTYCGGSQSCKYLVNNGGNNIYCNGHHSCEYASLNDINNTWSTATRSLSHSNLVSIKENVYCLALSSCQNAIISHVNGDVYSVGEYGNHDGKISNVNGTIFGIGYQSLASAKIVNSTTVLCQGPASCYNTHIKNVQLIEFESGWTFNGGSIVVSERSINKNMYNGSSESDINFRSMGDNLYNTNVDSEMIVRVKGLGQGLTIYCNESDTCKIDCVDDCGNIYLYCYGTCLISCDELYGRRCPEIMYGTFYPWIISQSNLNATIHQSNYVDVQLQQYDLIRTSFIGCVIGLPALVTIIIWLPILRLLFKCKRKCKCICCIKWKHSYSLINIWKGTNNNSTDDKISKQKDKTSNESDKNNEAENKPLKEKQETQTQIVLDDGKDDIKQQQSDDEIVVKYDDSDDDDDDDLDIPTNADALDSERKKKKSTSKENSSDKRRTSVADKIVYVALTACDFCCNIHFYILLFTLVLCCFLSAVCGIYGFGQITQLNVSNYWCDKKDIETIYNYHNQSNINNGTNKGCWKSKQFTVDQNALFDTTTTYETAPDISFENVVRCMIWFVCSLWFAVIAFGYGNLCLTDFIKIRSQSNKRKNNHAKRLKSSFYRCCPCMSSLIIV